ncbi:MAG: thiolase family protein [Acidobacteriota bacterium]
MKGFNDRHRRPRAVVVDGCRTPFLRAGGGFSGRTSWQLGATTFRALLHRTGLAPTAIDRVLLGSTVLQPDATNVAREAAFEAGLPASVPAVTLIAAGASASEAIARGAAMIEAGEARFVLAGGADCISDPPIGYRPTARRKLFRLSRARGPAARLRALAAVRPWDLLPDVPRVAERSTGQTMGAWTEELADRLGIERQAQDAFAVASHRRAAAAREHLARDIEPTVGAGGRIHSADDGIRANTDLEQLTRLRPSFRSRGTLTAGNSSFLTDGAAAVLLAEERAADEAGLRPLARIVGHVLTAHDPREDLLLGPVFAISRLLDSLGIELDAVDVVELHEAFAAQVLAVLQLLADDDVARERLERPRALGSIDPRRLNAWGGSLAIGNPFAPNGARLMTTACRRLQVEGGRLALGATCAGGGLGQAFLLERPSASDPSAAG